MVRQAPTLCHFSEEYDDVRFDVGRYSEVWDPEILSAGKNLMVLVRSKFVCRDTYYAKAYTTEERWYRQLEFRPREIAQYRF